MEFKKGDKVRLKEYPDTKGTVKRIARGVLWCSIVQDGPAIAFCEPHRAELVPK